jgi:hypothetical protein
MLVQQQMLDVVGCDRGMPGKKFVGQHVVVWLAHGSSSRCVHQG